MDYVKPAAIIVLPALGGLPSGYLTRKEIPGWYQTLNKPWFTPPNWLFPPMWTTLYGCMGYASYLIYKELGNPDVDARSALTLYAGQLALNWLWTPIFFQKHKIGLGAVIIWSDWALVIACIYKFHKINSTAGNLMVPLLGWLSLASCLNSYIWKYTETSTGTSTETGAGTDTDKSD